MSSIRAESRALIVDTQSGCIRKTGKRRVKRKIPKQKTFDSIYHKQEQEKLEQQEALISEIFEACQGDEDEADATMTIYRHHHIPTPPPPYTDHIPTCRFAFSEAEVPTT